MSPELELFLSLSPRARLLEKRSSLLASFLNEHGLAEPKSVEFAPLRGCQPSRCFVNVEAQVRAAGGQMETGWVFWEYEDISLHTEAHGIWITPQGRRRDITPRVLPPGKRVLFLPDARVAQKRGFTAGYRTSTSTNPRIQALVRYERELSALFDEFHTGMGTEFVVPADRLKAAANRTNLPDDAAKLLFERKRSQMTAPMLP